MPIVANIPVSITDTNILLKTLIANLLSRYVLGEYSCRSSFIYSLALVILKIKKRFMTHDYVS